ncbi:hypothetical protein DICPUDRAFT_76010 [Dictyostelium purpureum]|uniref:Uncharacterized protein n=1 Tax=Dictyostelium purpureum TaxID=5786 RepID=F0ZCB3_DICPU|nr:uncharacterized protein DICPUDRAFT_76010 [Dictyostelium purpureum]EGC38416.1 hypothetical protein DICPUDRAFT_76010 [Dictyostelium purpureum]|eukprot:XP_003285077.1 hypothetical protein DICPUDRAFT_76010 [Dictyostelium purpureum]
MNSLQERIKIINYAITISKIFYYSSMFEGLSAPYPAHVNDHIESIQSTGIIDYFFNNHQSSSIFREHKIGFVFITHLKTLDTINTQQQQQHSSKERNQNIIIMIEFSISYSPYLNILYIFGRYWEVYRFKKESLGFLATLNIKRKQLDLGQCNTDQGNSVK